MIVDDDEVMRSVLSIYIGAQPIMTVCGEAASPDDALGLVDEARPHLMLVDVGLGAASGFDLVASVRDRWPDLLCVMLSGHAEQRYVRSAFDAGARGYVVKSEPGQLCAGLMTVLAGGTYVSDGVRADR